MRHVITMLVALSLTLSFAIPALAQEATLYIPYAANAGARDWFTWEELAAVVGQLDLSPDALGHAVCEEDETSRPEEIRLSSCFLVAGEGGDLRALSFEYSAQAGRIVVASSTLPERDWFTWEELYAAVARDLGEKVVVGIRCDMRQAGETDGIERLSECFVEVEGGVVVSFRYAPELGEVVSLVPTGDGRVGG